VGFIVGWLVNDVGFIVGFLKEIVIWTVLVREILSAIVRNSVVAEMNF